LFDLIKDMSKTNAKGYEYTDRKGNLQGVLCDVEITSNVALYGSLVGVPNSWKVRNGVRKFHFERESMFRRAGVRKSEMGKYGKTIRPFFDLCHYEDSVIPEPGLLFSYWNPPLVHDRGICPIEGGFTTVEFTGGDWDRTTLVAADPDPTVNLGMVDSADQWAIALMDEHDVPNAPWGCVGMTYAYNQDRMEVVTPDADETIVANNPLALLASQSVTGGDVAEIAEEQELENPPYDIFDDGDSIRKIGYGQFRCIPHTNGLDNMTATAKITNLFLPAGFLAIEFSKRVYPGGDPDQFIGVKFDVHGIIDCKDWTEA
jgi:hypothetical protein